MPRMEHCVGIAALRLAKEILGTEQAIADVVGRSQPYVHTVLANANTDAQVPAEWCIPLERATEDKSRKICRGQFRPDIYPEHAAALHGKPSDQRPQGKRQPKAGHAEQGRRNPRAVAAGAG